LVAPVPVREIADKLVVSLQKVHVDRRIHCQVNIEPEVMFAGDKGDLLELLGNVIENAFKWCNGKIQISAESAVYREGKKRPGSIAITVEDNGPGIAEDQARAVLQRGVRADEQVAGHGIGLAIVKSIIELYEGKLTIGRSRMGGAKISIVI